MYMLFIIASNGFVESAFKELRFRQRFIARLAATNAQKHSNDALVRLFPQTVVNRLERDEPVPFETHSNDVIILWADISGFTKLCSDLPAPEVKRILDSLYSVLDHHVEQEQLWKMDTIGDAYVVIGGLNE
jgi:guanylate cyclase